MGDREITEKQVIFVTFNAHLHTSTHGSVQ